jgi:hypothetical protein
MKSQIAFLVFGLTSFLATADETNWVMAAPWFREVDGKLYNTQRSVSFKPFSGQVERVLTNTIILQQISQQPIYGEAKPNSLINDGNFLGYSGVPIRPVIGWNTVYGGKIFITNFPIDLNTTVGSQVSGAAMPVGRCQINDENLVVWDYGTPHRVMVITTNSTAEKEAKP